LEGIMREQMDAKSDTNSIERRASVTGVLNSADLELLARWGVFRCAYALS
jgi:hypothetical protein